MITLKINSALTGTFDYVSETDPAVDTGIENFEEQWDKYRSGELKEPPLKAGKEPTIWKIRYLRPSHMSKLAPYLIKATKQDEWAMPASWAVTAVALSGVDNAKDELGHNVKVMFEKDDDGEQIVSKEFMEALGFELITEISGVALERRTLSPL